MKNIKTLSPQQLHEWQQQNRDFVLLDVREGNEVRIASLPHHTHISMNLIPLRHNELPDDKPIVVYCHRGMRSMQVALFLQEVGFEQLYSLEGGIDAWSRQIDASVPTY
ncbi:rhodanese-like domain-containing protein [Neisseriaceae bacterium ESL0693]|nr:rhodanese-like domain-containing protein [Neisseriaceae bacterium ESL0693]